MGFEILSTVLFILLLLNYVILDCTVSKMKKENKLNIETISSIIALEKAMKKLNEALRSHDRRLNRYLHEISDIKDRLDILEAGHPDSEFDYATTDDDGNIIEVWFEGKRYVPEDKRDEDTTTLYADNKVVAETTRPDVKCCATCKHYHCGLRTWLHATKKYATMAYSACNNYEEASKPVEYIRYDRMYKALGGDGATEESLKRIKKLNYIYNTGLISMAEYRRRWEELMQNDT